EFPNKALAIDHGVSRARMYTQFNTRRALMLAPLVCKFLPTPNSKLAPSLLWLATVQCIEGEQDLSDLTPERCLVATESVQGGIRQIGKAQEAACEVGARVSGGWEVGWDFFTHWDVAHRSFTAGIFAPRVAAEHCVDEFALVGFERSGCLELPHLLSLDF